MTLLLIVLVLAAGATLALSPQRAGADAGPPEEARPTQPPPTDPTAPDPTPQPGADASSEPARPQPADTTTPVTDGGAVQAAAVSADPVALAAASRSSTMYDHVGATALRLDVYSPPG